MPIALVTALISSGGLILGSVIGAICSLFINKISLNEQIRIEKENLNYKEKCNSQEKYTNANIIRLDFCNAIYQSIRYLQQKDIFFEENIIPIYHDYHKIVASLCDEFSIKELSYIYQFYSILEKSNIIFKNNKNNELKCIINIRNTYKDILKKIYGDNYLKILYKDINNISYKQLYNDQLMKSGYSEILKSLDDICNRGYNAKKMNK